MSPPVRLSVVWLVGLPVVGLSYFQVSLPMQRQKNKVERNVFEPDPVFKISGSGSAQHMEDGTISQRENKRLEGAISAQRDVKSDGRTKKVV